jgi:2-keto-4-pentenoate hydratase
MMVKDDGLARATSLRQAAESISHIVPFIELPDLMVDPAATLTGPVIVAIDVGARLGVMGDPIPMQTEDAFIDALASMTVTLSEDGVELQRGPGAAIMDNPLNSAMWLARDLEKAGIRLKPGDLLSLGSFLPPKPPKPGTRATVKYLGLPGDPEVSVSFR